MIPISLGATPNAQPWASMSVDVESINHATGQALIESAQALRADARTETHPTTRVHLVLGPPGSGKTHLFGRLRRKLGPRAILVHLRPLVGADLDPAIWSVKSSTSWRKSPTRSRKSIPW